MANGDILSDFGINLLEEEIDDVIFQTNEFLTDATFTGAQGPFWWILQMCMALAALFSIVMAAGIAYKMMVKHEPLDVMKLFRPLAVSIIICWWYPPADTGMAGSRNNWCFLDFLSYIPNCIGSYTHDLYEAEASQISDIVDRLIQKDDNKESELAKDEKDNLEQTFRSQLPKMEKTEFYVDVQALGEQTLPVLITQSEYMRRMKEASKFQAGMAFYAQMPDAFNLVLNSDHPLIKQVLEDGKTACATELQPVESELKGLEARLAALHQSQNGKKQEEISQEEKDDVKNTESALEEQRTKKNNIIATYAAGNKVVHQLIDLALLQNGMLKGAALDSFLKRSVDLIK